MKHKFLSLLLVSFLYLPCHGQNGDPTTYTRVGDPVPSFTVKTLDGKTINIQDLKNVIQDQLK